MIGKRIKVKGQRLKANGMIDPVNPAALGICDTFNPSTIVPAYGAGGVKVDLVYWVD